MLDSYQSIELAVNELKLCDEQELLLRLGNISSKVVENPLIVNYYPESPMPIIASDVDLEVDQKYIDKLVELGKRIFSRWEKETYDLICGSDDKNKNERDHLMNAAGVGTFASALTLLLVSLGCAVGVATLIATIIAKRYFETAYDVFCTYWKENLIK